MARYLFVIDYQNDFVDGALGFPGAEKLDEKIAAKILSYGKGRVLFTRDTHFENYLETREGKNLPVKHCIKGSFGWEVYGETAKAFNWILPVQDAYTIWIDPETLRTKRFDSDLHEGDYTFRSTYLFDWKNLNVHTRWQSRQRPERYKTMKISDQSMDAVSLYFNLRTVKDEEIKEGFAKDLEMVLEDTVRYLSFRYDGREVKKVKGLGKFNTIKFRCKIATSDGFSFTDGTEFMVWISDDRNKIPLYIESPIKVGSVCAYLSSYEGLRYPLDCFIKK